MGADMTPLEQLNFNDSDLNRLPVLDEAIRKGADTLSDAQRKNVKLAWKLGKRLNERKALTPHGDWLPYLKDVGIPERSARDYMKIGSQIGSVADLGESIRETLEALNPRQQPWVARNTGDMEWFTPPEIIEAARACMGGIDLDPASCAEANEVVKAARYFTAENDGLAQEWSGRVWCNPPYKGSLMKRFAEKLAAHDGPWICITNNATETEGVKLLIASCEAFCLTAQRTAFFKPGGEKDATPLQGQIITAGNVNPARFENHFSEFGAVAILRRAAHKNVAVYTEGRTIIGKDLESVALEQTMSQRARQNGRALPI